MNRDASILVGSDRRGKSWRRTCWSEREYRRRQYVALESDDRFEEGSTEEVLGSLATARTRCPQAVQLAKWILAAEVSPPDTEVQMSW